MMSMGLLLVSPGITLRPVAESDKSQKQPPELPWHAPSNRLASIVPQPVLRVLTADYPGPWGGRDSRRRKRQASQANRTTTASAAKGAASASSESISDPPSSAVAMTGLPRPIVSALECALTVVVALC